MSVNVEDAFLLQLEVAFVSMLLRLSQATADLGNLVFLLHFQYFIDFCLSCDKIFRHKSNVGIVPCMLHHSCVLYFCDIQWKKLNNYQKKCFWGFRKVKRDCLLVDRDGGNTKRGAHSFQVPGDLPVKETESGDPRYQCSGSGSTGSTCFWASRIRIH